MKFLCQLNLSLRVCVCVYVLGIQYLALAIYFIKTCEKNLSLSLPSLGANFITGNFSPKSL